MSRFGVFYGVLILTALFGWLGHSQASVYYWPLLILFPLSILGLWDVVQSHHSLLVNYPILGHFRWILEEIRPELRQYFFSSDTEEMPFNREQRSVVYQRAKSVEDRTPFGSTKDVYEGGYAWLNHSIAPKSMDDSMSRILIGGPQCKEPYLSSVLNISAMSFGALSANAIQALNRGAKKGGFAHDTGEGGISKYHRAEGGDLIWEIGTGYFGCRQEDGTFSPNMFEEQAKDEQIKMVEVKISQGAKPGHGGILPANKVTQEIAEARRVPIGQDVESPPCHSAFSTPLELIHFIQKLRDLSGGKPVGFKLCIGHKWEFLAIVKAMLETKITPDFIVVDGSEGGTGAAPLEFSDNLGTPLTEGLAFVHNALTGANLRADIRLGASGKVISAFDIVKLVSLGADFCNAARAFMFSLGCIQSRTCHTNKCPSGVATQDKWRQRGLNVKDKGERVFNYHHNTIHALNEVLAAAGFNSPSELRHQHFYERDGDGKAQSWADTQIWLKKGELLEEGCHPSFDKYWNMAEVKSFAPKKRA